ncbi:MAG TPA: C-GCAxxG-C-C family protein [Lachnospiraceae bacterium]|nr:C-GCAxxG-C-C family protein [Lachnospiraceae bacterium]HPF29512.1 C-GCAxxG-C-C family protein [Lachnospiraceae bacterium]
MKSRVDDAVQMFEEGYNCCQSVFTTYADLFGVPRELALKISSPMGAGIGRMREVCGTVCAMSMLAGLKMGNTDPLNQQGKTAIYEKVQEMANCFKESQGTIICRERLKGIALEKGVAPELRTAQYYQRRPCSKIVANAAAIVEEMLLNEEEN